MNRHQRRKSAKISNNKHEGVMCHKIVENIAREMAGIFHDAGCSKSNEFYHYFRNQKLFIEDNWREFVGAARGSLTDMLTKPSYPEDQKEIILDALLLDRTLPKSQSRGIH